MKKTATKAKAKKKATKPKVSAIDPTKLLARDVMRTDLLTLRAEDSVESAVDLFEEYHVSGAPVVDAAGRPLGVLSASDIARRDHVREGRVAADRTGGLSDIYDDELEGADLEGELFNREDYSTDLLGRVRIGEWMSEGVVAVEPDTTLAETCRIMTDESIHRVFVVEGGQLRGVVSTFDVVALLAGR